MDNIDIEVEICLEEEIIDIITLPKDMKIAELRKQLENNSNDISKDFLFLRNMNPLKKNLEERLSIEKIVNDNNRIFIKLPQIQDLSPPLPSLIVYNEPIQGSEEIQSLGNIKIYKYPTIEFTSEQEDQSKVILLVGKTGNGKSSLINTLVNIYSGIQLEDKFRYKLIINNNESEIDSNTKEITIYKIKPKEGLNYPPLKIVDTPGFGDTDGIEEDMKHKKKFLDIFENKLYVINCICFVVKASDIREDPQEKYIFQTIFDLFAKDVRDNFMVGVTNFKPNSSKDIPDCIAKSLSSKNSFYYNCILKRENVTEEKENETNWYFSCDNSIITDEIEKNQITEFTWKETKKNVEILIEKIKSLESKEIKESSNIIKKRKELIEKIEVLTLRMDKIIYDRNRIKNNKAEEQHILDDKSSQQKYFTELLEEIKKGNDFKEKISKMNNSLENEIEKNKKFREEKIMEYRAINDKIAKIKEISSKRKVKKRINFIETETDNNNVICTECKYNCHENCNCFFSGIHRYFCKYISYKGRCSICNHSVSSHLRIQRKYIKKEIKENNFNEALNKQLKSLSESILKLQEEEQKIKNDNLKLEEEKTNRNEQIKSLDKIQRERAEHLKIIENVIKILKEEKEKVSMKIESFQKEIKLIEIEIIQILKQIKESLDYLRKNSLTKEYYQTMESYIDGRIKTCQDLEKKQYLINLRDIYNQLIAIENIDLSKMTYEKYIEYLPKLKV